ncbi:MAG TPA: phosphomannomutase, partial [Dongiaceae bacterium]
MQPGHRFQPSILREYDIRGTVGETLDPADATALGHAFVTLARQHCDKLHPRIAIGRDGRLSSPDLEAHLTAAIEAAGGIAVGIGCGPTPMLYFSTHVLGVDAGIMVTGSHNPPQQNGFKMTLGGAPVYGAAIQHLAALAREPQPATGSGSRQSADVTGAYLDRLLA